MSKHIESVPSIHPPIQVVKPTRSWRKDITGQRFGRWIVIGWSDLKSPSNPHWRCQCDCGVIKNINAGSLRSGDSKSCGCFSREKAISFHTTHGKTGTPTHKIWAGMKKRCYQKNSSVFYKYGGKGIGICDRWRGRKGFENFLADMGERPPGLTIGRIDNKKDYSPSNCRWETVGQQAVNKGNNVWVDTGETVSQYTARLGLNYKSFHYLYRHLGLPIEEASTKAVRLDERPNQIKQKRLISSSPL